MTTTPQPRHKGSANQPAGGANAVGTLRFAVPPAQGAPRPVKTYRRHNCERQHRTPKAMAKCLWPNAIWIVGTGPYATVSHCRRPEVRGDQTTVMLHATADRARTALNFIDRLACGGFCQRRHDLLLLHVAPSVS